MDRAARVARLRAISAFAVGFTILVSTTISEIVTVLAFVVLLIDGEPRENWRLIRGNPVVWASLSLFFLLGVCTLYSVVPLLEATQVWLKYRELLYLPLFLLLCRDRAAARAGFLGFLAAVVLIFGLGVYQWLVPLHEPASYFQRSGIFGSYIIRSVMMGLAAYHLAVEAILNSRWRKCWAFAAALALFYVLYLNLGRTGYVVALALAFLLLFQTATRKWLLPGILLITLVGGSVFVVSSGMGNRMSSIVAGVEGSDENAAASSAGLRLQFYRGSLAVIGHHPILGTGTGSFNRVYNAEAAVENLAPTANPHNEFLMIGVQTGIVGVAALLALFGALWFGAARLPPADAWRGRAVTLALAISCLFNSSLLDHVDGQSFAFQIGLFYFGISRREDQRHHHDV